MTKCHVCSLPADRRAAVEEAIRASVPLARIAETSGISKSGLSRHGKHLAGHTSHPPTARPTPQPTALIARPADSSAALGPSKDELLRRIEFLWVESLGGLEASKEPLQIQRRDGSTLTVPGDLRSRVGFLREARGVVELAGTATGHITKGDVGGAQVAIQIVCPAGAQSQVLESEEGMVLDIGVKR
jgi:hypothetical protein